MEEDAQMTLVPALRATASLAAIAGAIIFAAPAIAQPSDSASEAESPNVPEDEPAPANAAQPEDTNPVSAEAQGQDDETIIVTGSRLATGFTAPTPVQVVGAARLEQRGVPNIADVLNEVPAFRATNTPAGGELRPNAGYVGGRILDLRGLGSVRTLTLVDGKRFVPSTIEATVDTNMIPSILLERAEVVTGGASAQYGSDAVAGVVNLILNHQLEGLRANFNQSITKYGDGETTTIGLAGGTRLGENIHIIVGAEYEKAHGIGDCQKRPSCRTEVINVGRNPGDLTVPANNILEEVRPSTVPFNGVTVPPSSAYFGRSTPLLRPIDGITFNADGTPRRFQYGTYVNNLWMQGGEGEGETIYFKNFFNSAPLERLAITGALDWEISPAITASLMVNYGQLDSEYSASIYRNIAITMRNDNPFLPRSTDPTLDIPTILAASGLTSFQLGKGFAELGRAPIVMDNKTYRVVGGLEGDLGGSWNWDAYYQYGKNKFRSETSNTTITSRMLRALDATTDAGGNPVCRVNVDANPANDDPSCVAYNPFGNQASDAAKAYVTGTAIQTTETTEHVLAANLRGNLFQLPYGPLAVAIGGEYRSDGLSGTADPLSQQLAFFAGNASAVSGKIKVTEGYAEANLPLLADLPFANELSLNGAVRRTHYKRSSDFHPSSTVNVTTYKYGIVFGPSDWIRFRATQSRDIRAPNINELFGPNTLSAGILNDPFRGGQQTNPTVRGGSNPTLEPEKADTFTIGVVLKPSSGFLRRFRASIDYFDIDISNAIATLGQQNIVNRCFQGEEFACTLITRDPGTGLIVEIDDVLQNVNRLIARGVDFELDYRQPLGSMGDLDFRLLGTHIRDFITVDTVGSVDRAGQTGLRGGFPQGLPDWSVDALVSWQWNAFTLNGHVRWINKGFYNSAFIGPDDPDFSITSPFSSNINEVPSKTYVDLLAQYRVEYGTDREFAVYVGVDNIFNTWPPQVPGAHGTGNNILFNPAGRTYKAGLRVTY
jgi:outer membrane receptor protein involved in Fe transport